MVNFHKNQPKSWKFSTKNQPKSLENHAFFRTIQLMFTDINISPINNKTDHFSEKYIFYRKKVKQKLFFFSRIRYFTKRIRIHIKMKRIRNTDFNIISLFVDINHDANLCRVLEHRLEEIQAKKNVAVVESTKQVLFLNFYLNFNLILW